MPAILDYIVIHHSATRDSGTVSWSAIRAFHMKPKSQGGVYGMVAVGYHFGVEMIGTEVEVLRGRSVRMDGAHCVEAGMNRRSIGVCVVGDYDAIAPGSAIQTATLSFVRDLMALTRIPRERVIGHREAGLMAGFDWAKGQYKSCPGRSWDMVDFRMALSA